MPTHPSYSRAPITEAILDIRVQPLGLDLEALKALGGRTPVFTTTKIMNEIHGQMKFHEDPSTAPEASATTEPAGFVFISPDQRRLWQARLNGFTLSHLAPYKSWGELKTEAIQLWSIFKEATKPTITRIAVRYVNRFDLPGGKLDFADYFETVPKIPTQLDTGLSGYFMQLLIPQPIVAGMVIINQALVPPVNPGTIAVVLDIDLFCEGKVPQNDDEMWIAFEALHNRKNEIFEACISDAARELIR